jgi:hypothetical protein
MFRKPASALGSLAGIPKCFHMSCSLCGGNTEMAFMHSVKLPTWKLCSKSGHSIGLSHCLFTGKHETIFASKFGSIHERKSSRQKQVWSGATLLVISLLPMGKGNLDMIGLIQAVFDCLIQQLSRSQ